VSVVHLNSQCDRAPCKGARLFGSLEPGVCAGLEPGTCADICPNCRAHATSSSMSPCFQGSMPARDTLGVSPYGPSGCIGGLLGFHPSAQLC